MILTAFAKKFFGCKYEKITKNIFMGAVIFFGVSAAGFKLNIAPFIICLMVNTLIIGDLWQAMSSEENSNQMKNLFMLPFSGKELIFSYVSCLGAYSFWGRLLPLLAIVLAIIPMNIRIIPTIFLCFLHATVVTAALFVCKKIRGIILAWLGASLVAMYFFVNTFVYMGVLLAGILIFGILLSKADVYAFYVGEGRSTKAVKGRVNSSVWVYFLRYMKAHKNYLVNTVFVWGLACILPTFFVQVAELDQSFIGFIIPVGFAILSMNTPISIMLSCDPSLEQAVRFLPGQKKAFCIPYFAFVFVCNIISQMIYLVSCHLQLGGVTGYLILGAVVVALQCAICTVLMEWFFPIHGWKVENDLWHHPRKYIVPVGMVLVAGIVGVVPIVAVALLLIVLVELIFLARMCYVS